MSKAEKKDYQLAKNIIDCTDLHEEVYVEPTVLPNFRKYLREIVYKRKTTQQFTTRNEDKGLRVIRIR